MAPALGVSLALPNIDKLDLTSHFDLTVQPFLHQIPELPLRLLSVRSIDALREVYSRLIGAMIWYRNNDPYNPAALCLLNTHYWQLANCRHRPVTLLGRTDHGVDAATAPTLPEGRPSLEHFRGNGTRVERGEGPLSSAEARLKDLQAGDILPETKEVIGGFGGSGASRKVFFRVRDLGFAAMYTYGAVVLGHSHA